MVAASLPVSLAGVGVTAIGVALIRARESGRSDRLFDDPYALRSAERGRRVASGGAEDQSVALGWPVPA